MLAKSDAFPDSPTGLELRPEPLSAWRVSTVAALPGFRLELTFRDGTEGLVDMRSAIFAPTAGVFAALRDEALFGQVRVETGAPVWPGGLDIAPDALYDGVRSSANGVYSL
jgi:hypothetical protein